MSLFNFRSFTHWRAKLFLLLLLLFLVFELPSFSFQACISPFLITKRSSLDAFHLHLKNYTKLQAASLHCFLPFGSCHCPFLLLFALSLHHCNHHRAFWRITGCLRFAGYFGSLPFISLTLPLSHSHCSVVCNLQAHLHVVSWQLQCL